MTDVFLSYSREDQPTARRFAEALKREGFSVWWDQALDAGESFDKVTEQALEEAKAVVVLWSKRSVQSDWVRAEATQARANDKLVPVTIEPCKRPIMFELTHTADLSEWNGDVAAAPWRAFIEGLRRTVGKTASPVTASATPAPIDAAPRSVPRAAIAWSAIAAAVLLAGGLYWRLHGSEAKSPTAGAPATAPAMLASIAVLPFKDMSQGKDQEYFADGVTEEILNTLAGLKDLRVTARTSAFAFKGKDVDLRTVGQTLGVQHILEGSIRKDGETLRITAQLIDAKSDAHVWSKTYDRPLKDIFKVQEEIARSVAEALQVTLGVGFGNQPGMTRNVEAYDAYLAAWPAMLQQTAESQRRAIGLLEQAVARDPSFGRAWLFLANAYGGMTALVTQDAQAWRQKADVAIENARRLAPGNPGVHFALAQRSISQTRWTEAAEHYKDLAAELARRGAPNSFGTGRFLLMMGSAREAVAALEEEKARDPLNPETAFFLGQAYSALGNFAAASAEFDRGFPLDASWRYLLQVGAQTNALGSRDRAEVKRRLEVQIASSAAAQRKIGTQLIALLDRPADALAYLRAQARDPATPALTMGAVSQYLAYFGVVRCDARCTQAAGVQAAGA
jgi:TolB-like protein/cytochrome c-type biogenesis protein CcmH/NrfG